MTVKFSGLQKSAKKARLIVRQNSSDALDKIEYKECASESDWKRIRFNRYWSPFHRSSLFFSECRRRTGRHTYSTHPRIQFAYGKTRTHDLLFETTSLYHPSYCSQLEEFTLTQLSFIRFRRVPLRLTVYSTCKMHGRSCRALSPYWANEIISYHWSPTSCFSWGRTCQSAALSYALLDLLLC